MPCPGPFHVSHIADYIYDFCLLPDPDFGLSLLVCDFEHTSFHFGCAAARLFCAGKVAIEDIPVFGVCRPACHDTSLYLFALVLFLEAVALSQVCIGVNIFYQHIVNVYWGVVYNQHLCLCDVHVKTHSPTLIE